MQKPRLTPELLTWLEAYFPDRMVDPDATDRQVWLKCGQVSVVRFLRNSYEEQEADGLDMEGL